jgi:anti-anti-sigma factor
VVVVDLRELSFIDANGLAVLIRAQAHAPRSGLRLEVMPGDRVRRLLVLCGVATYFAYAEPPAE